MIILEQYNRAVRHVWHCKHTISLTLLHERVALLKKCTSSIQTKWISIFIHSFHHKCTGLKRRIIQWRLWTQWIDKFHAILIREAVLHTFRLLAWMTSWSDDADALQGVLMCLVVLYKYAYVASESAHAFKPSTRLPQHLIDWLPIKSAECEKSIWMKIVCVFCKCERLIEPMCLMLSGNIWLNVESIYLCSAPALINFGSSTTWHSQRMKCTHHECTAIHHNTAQSDLEIGFNYVPVCCRFLPSEQIVLFTFFCRNLHGRWAVRLYGHLSYILLLVSLIHQFHTVFHVSYLISDETAES